MNFKFQISNLNFFKKVINLLSSKVFLFWIIGGWVVYYVLTTIWMKESFATFVGYIEKRLIVQIPFVLFLISGYLNLIRTSKDIFKKGRLKFFLWIFLPLGALLFFTGFFISITTRQFGWFIVGEGQSLKPQWSSESYIVTNIKHGLRDSLLDTDVGRGKGIFEYEPKITIMDSSSRTYEIGAFPPRKIGDTYYHILNFGIAPGIRFFEGNVLKSEGYMLLKIIIPNSSDYFDIPPYPYRFLISIEPEKTVQKGMLKASQYNLKMPVYNIRVFKGEKVIAESISRSGISFDNLMLSFFEPTYWIQLEIAKDIGVPVIISGLCLIIIGIPLFLIRVSLKFLGKT